MSIEEPSYVRVDVEGLKVLAHPLRVRLLGLLRTHGPGTASGLAARVGESSGTTSWHLRRLADAGFIEPDTERGNRRERWWRAAQDFTQVSPRSMPDEPEAQDALGAYLRIVVDAHHEQAREFIRSRHTWPEPWRHVSHLSDCTLSLSETEARDLHREYEELLSRYRRAAVEGDQTVSVQLQSFPMRIDRP
ncbi:winged helix-turn-helix domain-containing protein [Actinokineospora sp. NBRC 105648]|uniref:winged helix-turn-helix domain-containing protein n=1 Tax=Actinokineospora sp. NBRC 105648 TaxID=3032206 RepID=UPI0024A35DE7|nr:winged helix-turn-helix domain-containing protein [Actinokineospora sp. NBRC 105648]GLZ37287.1 transcriptional regulator [Actinokineospora sp. NBRC 105648]